MLATAVASLPFKDPQAREFRENVQSKRHSKSRALLAMFARPSLMAYPMFFHSNRGPKAMRGDIL